MKKTIEKIGKIGKPAAAVLGFAIALFTAWGIIKTQTTKNIGGEWYLEFKVEKSSYLPYIGETHTQKVYFIQTDKTVTGDGEKWEYNGKLLPFDAHRKLEYHGSVDGSKFRAKYVMHGLKRISEGMIDVIIDGEELSGTFSGTAGESSGMVTGKKIE